MNKVLVTIYAISIDESFDMFLPISLKMSDALDLIQSSISDLSGGNYQKNDNALLYFENGLIINSNNTIKFSGIKNGCKLLLV